MLAGLAFSFPWALAALAALPGLWWLLRALPPAPHSLNFPAIRLLVGLQTIRTTPQRMPPWLLVLRLCLALLLILAAAGPVLNPEPTAEATTGPLLLAFDDGWASASAWASRRAWADARAQSAIRNGRPVLLLPTAPPEDGLPVRVLGPMTAAEARAALRAWVPKPWNSDRAAAAQALEHLDHLGNVESLFLADGVEDGHSATLISALSHLGNGPIVTVTEPSPILRIGDDPDDPSALGVTIVRPDPDAPAKPYTLRVATATGQVLDAEAVNAQAGAGRVSKALHLPVELRNRAGRIDIETELGASTVWLMDESSRRRPVALGESWGAFTDGGEQSLLDPLTYPMKAITPFADPSRGGVPAVLDGNPSVLVMADIIPDMAEDAIGDWVRHGGMLIRFAGPQMAQKAGALPSDLLPTRLRGGGRELGGTLSWTEPQAVAPFPAGSPFVGLPVPADITVSTQVLAEPDDLPQALVWARLADGTPLVTAKRLDRGWVVLFHVGAAPGWSTLPLSGVFPDMLRRLIALSAAPNAKIKAHLAPLMVLDGLGRLGQPGPAVTAIDGDPALATPGPSHPPGLYGDASGPVAFNLGPALGVPQPLALPPGTRTAPLDTRPTDVDFRPPVLAAALVLALFDLLVTVLWLGRPGILVTVILLAVWTSPRPATADDLTAALQPRLAYVITDNPVIDRKSATGLANLTVLLGERSTAVLAEPRGVHLDSDTLALYPLLYWPVPPDSPTPSEKATSAIQSFLSRGGLVVIDSQDGGDGGASTASALRRLGAAIDLPPLEPIGQDHVLRRSFYLIKRWPGRFTDTPLWVQPAEGRLDGVSGVVLGSADWAGEWASGLPSQTIAADIGGDLQRESAFRFGINLCIYALTGNYKGDQVHLPAIMERLRRQP